MKLHFNLQLNKSYKVEFVISCTLKCLDIQKEDNPSFSHSSGRRKRILGTDLLILQAIVTSLNQSFRFFQLLLFFLQPASHTVPILLWGYLTPYLIIMKNNLEVYNNYFRFRVSLINKTYTEFPITLSQECSTIFSLTYIQIQTFKSFQAILKENMNNIWEDKACVTTIRYLQMRHLI